MKKILLFASFAFVSYLTQAQVVVEIIKPDSLAGAKTSSHVLAGAANNTWGYRDMTDPLNAVTGKYVFVEDGTPGDTLNFTKSKRGCTTPENGGVLTNAAALKGNIAVVYRGLCTFVEKVTNAQNAGAIAVIVVADNRGIINITGGDPTDTIPIAMIGNADGKALEGSAADGTGELYFGVKRKSPVDLQLQLDFTRLTSSTARQSQITKTASDYAFVLATNVFNVGTDAQEDAVVKAVIDRDGVKVGEISSNPFDIAVGDTVFVTFPNFTLATYPTGTYTVTYTAAPKTTDGFTNDNSVKTSIYLNDEFYSVAPIDPNTLLPTIGSVNAPAAGVNTFFTWCTPFIEPNASRLEALGMNFYAAGIDRNAAGNPVLGDITGELVTLELLEWNDDISEEYNIDLVSNIASTEVIYESDESFDMKTAMFPEKIKLKDNQKYLVCITTSSDRVWVGGAEIDYNINDDSVNFSYGPFRTPDGWAAGFAGGVVPAITLITNEVVGINNIAYDKNVKPFPMPAVESITIPLNTTKTGNVEINVLDLTGKSVASKTVAINEVGNVKVTTSDLSAGMYTFVLKFNDNAQSSFKVQINK